MNVLPHHPPRAVRRPSTRQHGVSLIEVLVTLLILTVGLLGMSSLQARAIKGAVSSYQRGQAVIYGQYMLDLMRIDRTAAKNGDYDITTSDCSPAGFSGGTLAQTSLKQWLGKVQTDVGKTAGGTTCAAIDCNSDYQCSVTIQWDDSRAGGIGAQKVTVSSRI